VKGQRLQQSPQQNYKIMKNPLLEQNLLENKEKNKLKSLIVQYVGETLMPESEDITIDQVIKVFANEFPEFIVCVAEENWVNGYSQALKDVDFFKSRNEASECNQILKRKKSE